MSEPDQGRAAPSLAMQWTVLVAALAVIAATVVVVVTGPAASPVADPTAGSTTVPATSPAPTASTTPSEPAEPRDPAEAVLDPLDPGTAATAAGVAASLGPLLAHPDLGAQLGAAVLDPVSDELLLDVDATGAHVPASITKVLTALATLEAVGPDTRFRTTVVRAGAAGRDIVLVGGGDPALSQRVEVVQNWAYPFTRFDLLARATADELLAAGTRTVRLGYAEDLFSGPAVNPAWEPGYVPAAVVAPVSALSLDGGRARPGFAQRVADPARYAAETFAGILGTYGVQVEGAPTAQPTPAGEMLASVESPTVAELVGQMLDRSDNDVAEMLARHVARAEGVEPTFAGGGRAIEAVIGRLGVPTGGLVLTDGSGLSRQNRLSAATVARALEAAYEDRDGSSRSLLTGLPVAGFTGSLSNRFDDPETSLEAGDIRAKTGYLTGVVALAGYLVTADGQAMIFVTIADAVVPAATLGAQSVVDQIAAELAACGCS